ncbi:MAG: hypothetical protein ACRDOX_02705 [Nocardioides sp.]
MAHSSGLLAPATKRISSMADAIASVDRATSTPGIGKPAATRLCA